MAITTSGERLADIIYSNRMSRKDFANALGYNPSYITQLCSNMKEPSQEFAQKVEKVFGVSADLLLYGKEDEGHSYTSPVKETVLAKVRRISSDNELLAVLSFINCYEELPKIEAVAGKSHPPVRMAVEPKLYTVPIKGEVAGGSPMIAYESHEDTIKTPIYADSALYIKGKSMEPDYPDGSLVLVKENAYVANGDVVIALIMNEAEIAEATCKIINKKKGAVTLSPINQDFEVQKYSSKDGCEIKIFGKVIGKAD